MSDKVYIAIPLMDELDNLDLLVDCIRRQKGPRFEAIFCVNQPEAWWDHDSKRSVCRRNAETLKYLSAISGFPLTVIDRSTRGKGWQGKKHGVGMARKTLMDHICEVSSSDRDIIISLDGDTVFDDGYFSSVQENLEAHSSCLAVSVPYYHPLTDSEAEDAAILRYEIYMRHYLLNLLRIDSPYAFTALGSAMAFTAGAYKKIGGMSPVLSGEDFYLLQKFAKAGKILIWNEKKVYPAARFSDRVYFGTGPAMIKGSQGDWSSYPVYHPLLFDDIKKTYLLFPSLYEKDVRTPMDDFLSSLFPGLDVWQPLRKNSTGVSSFTKACHQKVDGLRVLQYLKWQHNRAGHDDASSINYYFENHVPANMKDLVTNEAVIPARPEIPNLKIIREYYTRLTDEACRRGLYTGLG